MTIKDFLSHENTDLAFEKNDQVLLDGASGAGKSSVFDAIIWSLYGQSRVDNRSLVRKGGKKAVVTLELTSNPPERLGHDTIVIERSTTPKGKHELSVSINGVAHPLTGVRDLQNYIDKDLIGASYLLFINSVAYVQGSAESFVGQTAPRRKELLLEIVKADDYSKYYDKAHTALTELGKQNATLEGELTASAAQRDILVSRLKGRPALMQILQEETRRLLPLEASITALKSQKSKDEAVAKSLSLLKDIHSKAVLDVNRVEAARKVKEDKVAGKGRLETLLKGRPGYVKEIAKTEEALAGLRADLEYRSRRPDVTDRSAAIARHEEHIAFLKSKPVCPAGDACPYHSKTNEEISYNVSEAAKLLALNTKENLALAEWAIEGANRPPVQEVRQIIKEIQTVEAQLSNLKREEAHFADYQRELDTLVELEKELKVDFGGEMQRVWTEVADAKKALDDAEAAIDVSRIEKTENDLGRLLQEEKEVNGRIVHANASLEALDRDEQGLKAVDKSIKLAETTRGQIQEKARKVALVKEAFGSKGIESMVIDYLLPQLEDRINEVLKRLSDFRVRLDTQRKSVDGESTIEGLFITILNDLGEELPFESYSGGEKLKISVSISEALAGLQKVGFRLFDETFLGLDENSTEAFADVLISLQKRFGQVFCISHLLQIKELFDKKVVVSKNSGISHVRTTANTGN